MILGKLNIPIAGNALKNSLISCWEFEETLGTTLYDANGNWHFTANNSPLINQDAGKLGKSILLNGINQFLNLSTTNMGLVGTDTISVSYWIKPVGITTDMGALINTYNRNTAVGFITAIRPLTGGNIAFQCTNINGASNTRQRISTFIPANQWVHYVGIIYPSTTPPDLFCNNAPDNNSLSSSGTVNQLYFGGYNVALGRESYRTTPTGWFKGNISQAAIWKRALTATEIALLYNAGNGLTYLNW